jgi:hypothetical protein
MISDDDEDVDNCFGTDVLSLRETLERLEAKLLESGQDEVIISTSRGSWTWQRAPN